MTRTPLPLPLSQAWERGARKGGVRDEGSMNFKRVNLIKVNTLVCDATHPI